MTTLQTPLSLRKNITYHVHTNPELHTVFSARDMYLKLQIEMEEQDTPVDQKWLWEGHRQIPVVVFARAKNNLIGVIIASESPDGGLELGKLYVDPLYRRMGIGTTLRKLLISTCDIVCPGVPLFCWIAETNFLPRQIASKMGWVDTGDARAFTGSKQGLKATKWVKVRPELS